MLISEARAGGMTILQKGHGADEVYVRMHQEREGRALSRQRQPREDESPQGKGESAARRNEGYGQEADDAKRSPRKRRSRSQSPRFHRSSSPIISRIPQGRAVTLENFKKLHSVVDEEVMRERADSAAGDSRKD